MHTFAEEPKAIHHIRSAKSIKPRFGLLGHIHEVNPILHLQRTIGNQAVLRLLQSDAEELQLRYATAASKRYGHDFSRIPVHAARPETTRIQGHPSSILDTHGPRSSTPIFLEPGEFKEFTGWSLDEESGLKVGVNECRVVYRAAGGEEVQSAVIEIEMTPFAK